MSTDVFLSVGRTYLPEQEAFVADLEATLRGLESIREPSGAATACGRSSGPGGDRHMVEGWPA
jgi:hypothetical protein